MKALKTLPAEAVQVMLTKATKLVQKGTSAIVQAPGANAETIFIVESSSGKPHLLTVKKREKVECHFECVTLRGKQICSHAIAVAEQIGKLESYFEPH